MTAPAAIKVVDLRVVRGDAVVLPGLSCEVEAGSVTGLLGPSGSGKSTLLRAIVAHRWRGRCDLCATPQ